MTTAQEWQPIVVAMDRSRPAMAAAAVGWHMADRAGTTCNFVHAAPDLEAVELLGVTLRAALRHDLPAAALDRLVIVVGAPTLVLKDAVRRLGAGLLILGGRHHGAVGRLLGGHVVRDAVRSATIPVLVTRGAPTALRRVLAGVDLSHAAEPTIRAAERFATLEHGALRALHVLEPVRTMPDIAQFVDQPRFNADSGAVLERDVWPLLRLPGAERAVRMGQAVAALTAEAIEWRADLLVLGSHRKDRLERLLLGSTTERLLRELPVSILVVPTRRAGWLDEAAAPRTRVAAERP